MADNSDRGFRTFGGAVPQQPAQRLRSHPKDPRLIRPTAGAYNQSADVAQLAYAKRDLREGEISQHDARIKYADYQSRRGLSNLPTQLTFTPFGLPLTGLAANQPVLLVPRNPNRYGLLFSYQTLGVSTGAVGYCFGPPFNLGAAGIVGVFFNGTVAGFQPYVNDAVPIDDVWVFVSAANTGVFLVYEGTIALDGNMM